MDGTAPLPAGRQTGSYPEMSLTGNLQSEIVLLTDAARQKESARWRASRNRPYVRTIAGTGSPEKFSRLRGRVALAPDRPWSELRVLRLDVQIASSASTVLGGFELALDGCLVDGNPGGHTCQLKLGANSPQASFAATARKPAAKTLLPIWAIIASRSAPTTSKSAHHSANVRLPCVTRCSLTPAM